MIRRVVVSDDPQWAGAVQQLFTACEIPSRGTAWRQSELFLLRPYAPLDCTCSHAAAEQRWHTQHKHHASCAVHLLSVVSLDDSPYALRNAREQICEELGLEQLSCTCGHDEALEAWRAGHPHDLYCASGPNFFFAPRQYALWWYEEPLRGAWATHPLTTREFLRIFEQCLGAL